VKVELSLMKRLNLTTSEFWDSGSARMTMINSTEELRIIRNITPGESVQDVSRKTMKDALMITDRPIKVG